MKILERYLPRIDFDSYEDFKSNFKINVPDNFDFAHDVVDFWAEAEPNKRALLYCDDSGYAKAYTFTEISELSKKMATYLISLGIKKGDRIMTLLRRRWEYWALAVATVRIGAVLVPCAMQMRNGDIAYRLNECHAKMLIALEDSYILEQIDGLKSDCKDLRHIAIVNASKEYSDYLDFDKGYSVCEQFNERILFSNEDDMLVYFTSGTTGYPKMAVHARTYPLGHIITAKYMQRVLDNGLHLTQTDSGWAKFGWGNIYGQWICGSAILAYDPDRFNPENLMKIMEKFRPTTICIPPTMYRFLMHDGLTYEHIKSVTWFTTAGEPLSADVNQNFYNISGKYVREGYGQSEGTPITCNFEWLLTAPTSLGKPSPLYDVRIIDHNGQECNIGETGEIVIMAKEGQLGLLKYYMEKGRKINPIKKGIYHTGDTAYMDENGFIWYVGRVDDMIKCSGYRIGPFEIESILNSHTAVKESAIVGAPDEIRGQIVCAVIKLKAGITPSEELTNELKQYVKDNTAPYKYPRRIVYVDEIPKTTTGKIIRSEARKFL